MMKVMLLLVALLVVSVAAENSVSYAGTTADATTFTPPDYDGYNDGVACTASDYSAPFVYFNVSFAVSGVREIAAIAESPFSDELAIFIYATPFNPSTPCVNLLTSSLENQYGNNLPVDDVFYFAAGVQYTVVITADEANDAENDGVGYFGVTIFASVYNTNITQYQTQYWPGLEDDYDEDTSCAALDDSADLPYAAYTWTQIGTGVFDIKVVFYNASLQYDDWDGSIVALYNSTVDPVALAANPCLNTLVAYDYEDEISATIFYAQLVNGTVYTLIGSPVSTDQTGHVGFQIQPTRVRLIPHLSGWTQPEQEYDEDDYTCTVSDDDTDAAWDAFAFNAAYQVYLFDTDDAPEQFQYFDTYTFMYSGDQTPDIVGDTPSTCPVFGSLISQEDTGSEDPVYASTGINNTYTVVVSTWSGDELDDGDAPYAYILYEFTGLPVGSIPAPSTTGSATNGGATVATIGGSTNTGATVIPSSYPTPKPTTTSATPVPSTKPTSTTGATPNPSGKPTPSVPVTTTSSASTTMVATATATVVLVLGLLF